MSREIPLTKGYATMVDDADYDWLSQWRWCANVKGHGVYAYRTRWNGPGGSRSVYMHRQILGILEREGVEGDHRSGDTLDNRRSNLRVVSRWQNSLNQRNRRDSSTGVRGVDYVKKDGVYRVRVYPEGQGEVVVGYTKTLDEARELREQAQAEAYGEYTRVVDTGREVGAR